MRGKRGRIALMLIVATALSGCASRYTTRGAAVSYNRAFAEARSEIVLLNILRASVGEPLQFSAITSVAGAAQNSSSISIPFTNILFGGEESINPTLSLGMRNPNVTLTPLETDRFVLGILRPVGLETLDNLIAQGWDRPTVLSLVVGGVQCGSSDRSGEDVRLNFGPQDSLDAALRGAFIDSRSYTAGRRDREIGRLRLPLQDALKLLREGGGAGREIRIAEPRASEPALPQGHVDLAIIELGPPHVEGLSFTGICPALTTNDQGAEAWGLLTRSVQAMFRYAGASHLISAPPCGDDPPPPPTEDARRALPPLVTIRSMCGILPAPGTAAISTRFRGRTYYVLRSDRSTLQVLELLNILTSLQTTESSVASTRPINAITQ